MSRSGRAEWALIVVALLVLSGCGKSASRSAGTALTVAVRADVTGIFPNPPTQTESHTFDVNSSIFEGLVRFDRNLSPVPALADRWENPNEQTWIFHIRPGLRFSTGEPVRPEDVVASLDAAKRKGWATSVFLEAIKSVRVSAKDSVEIQTRTPYALPLSKLHYGFILPARCVDMNPVPPVGTGPYELDRWNPGRELVLKRNRFYREPTAPYESIRFRVCPDPNERMSLVRAGEAQIADNLPLSSLDSLSRSPGVKLFSGTGLRVIFLAFRMDRRPFSDPRVREAIDLAIDRPELISRALGGHGLPASQLVAPSIFGYNPALTTRSADRAGARKLLREAGLPNGFSVRLDSTNNRYVNETELLAEVARQLAEIGIHISVNPMPKDRFFPLLEAGGSNFFMMGWACETRDAGDALDAVVHSRTAGWMGSNNYQSLADPELDRLIDEANNSPDLSQRNERLAQALARVAQLRAIIPLEIQTETVAVSTAITWNPPVNFGLRLFTP